MKCNIHDRSLSVGGIFGLVFLSFGMA